MAKQPLRGMLDTASLKKMVETDDIETVLTVFPDIYGRLLGKRISGRFFVDDVLDSAIHACDYLLACDMEMEPVPGYEYTSWDKGYGDFRLVPDISTLRTASWLDKTALVFCDVYDERDDEFVPFAPRTILRQQVERATKLGYIAMAGSELELYVFKDTFESAADKQYINLEPFGRYIEDYHILQGTKEEFVIGAIRHHMDRSGVPVEFSKGEWGPGQQEINLRFAEFMEMADRHTLYKHAAKEIALAKECAITFMSKWHEKYAGSSMHLHASLWDKSGINSLVPGDEKFGDISTSPIFRWFLGGWIKHVREVFAFYAPYPVSYKRFVAGSFAPTGLAWSHDNRTAAFRVIGHGPSLRIECRAPGADANPYLAFAATLAAGLDGIENQIEPPEPYEGDVYKAKDLDHVPKSLNEAIHELDKSEWARKTFGEDVVEHYVHFFKTEQQKFDAVVTDWERARYFERA